MSLDADAREAVIAGAPPVLRDRVAALFEAAADFRVAMGELREASFEVDGGAPTGIDVD